MLGCSSRGRHRVEPSHARLLVAGQGPGRAEPCSAAFAGRVRVRRTSSACPRFNLGEAAPVGRGKASGDLPRWRAGAEHGSALPVRVGRPGDGTARFLDAGRHPGRAEPCSAALAGRVRVRRPSDVCPRFNLGEAASVGWGKASGGFPALARGCRAWLGTTGARRGARVTAPLGSWTRAGTRVEPSHARLLLPAEFAYAGHPTCARVSASAKPRRSAGERFRAGLPRWRAGAEHGSALPVRVGVPGRRRRSVPGRGQAPG
ncbi:hypothetical protein M2421_001878 [Stenotrophomonas sp. BIGb0135]|nr:hypothetical protein [Stenotrophomonas sp. BIGb0135]